METYRYVMAFECRMLMQAVEQTLKTHTSLHCMGHYDSYQMLQETLLTTEIKTVILDRFIIGEKVQEGIYHLRELRPDLRLLLFCPTDCTLFDPTPFIEAGIDAILGKDATTGEFEDAVRADGYYFNRWFTNHQLQATMRRQALPPTQKLLLSKREQEILILICSEKTTREIADICCLSERTIEGIRRTLLEKTNAHSTAGLVAYAFRKKIYK